MTKLPKDCPARIIGSEARKLVHYRFSSQRWEYRESTGRDSGVDCVIELIEDEEWTNKKLEGQIKGTKSPNKLKGEQSFSFGLDVKTINYGLSCSNAFVLFYVDVEEEQVYYLPLQDYFIKNPELFDKLEQNGFTMNVHIPFKNIVSEEDLDLCQIAKKTYIGGPSHNLKEVTVSYSNG